MRSQVSAPVRSEQVVTMAGLTVAELGAAPDTGTIGFWDFIAT
jgi:hypothetical protein